MTIVTSVPDFYQQKGSCTLFAVCVATLKNSFSTSLLQSRMSHRQAPPMAGNIEWTLVDDESRTGDCEEQNQGRGFLPVVSLMFLPSHPYLLATRSDGV